MHVEAVVDLLYPLQARALIRFLTITNANKTAPDRKKNNKKMRFVRLFVVFLGEDDVCV